MLSKGPQGYFFLVPGKEGKEGNADTLRNELTRAGACVCATVPADTTHTHGQDGTAASTLCAAGSRPFLSQARWLFGLTLFPSSSQLFTPFISVIYWMGMNNLNHTPAKTSTMNTTGWPPWLEIIPVWGVEREFPIILLGWGAWNHSCVGLSPNRGDIVPCCTQYNQWGFVQVWSQSLVKLVLG